MSRFRLAVSVGQVVTHAVALAADVDESGVVNEAIDDGSRDDDVV
jgi:hypothetical protein